MKRRAVLGATVAAAWIGRARAQESAVTLTRSLGINYLPTHVIEHEGLIERHARRRGLSLRVAWVALPIGTVGNDALLAGSVDIVNTGIGSLLLLWDRTRGGVKGIVSTSAQPLALLTRSPRVRTLADFGPGDRIAVPTVRVSTQAILLQMACAASFGADQWGRLDPLTVQLSHPDAAAALANPGHEVNTHFSAPPYSFLSLRTVPGVRAVPMPDGTVSQVQMFTTVRFAQANPAVIASVRDAAADAAALIAADRRAALAIYRRLSGDRTDPAVLEAMLDEPGMMAFQITPRGTLAFAHHLHRIGTLRTRAASWAEYYLPAAHDLDGS
jgi:NitT/TauT family transport system substrate-binding protein